MNVVSNEDANPKSKTGLDEIKNLADREKINVVLEHELKIEPTAAEYTYAIKKLDESTCRLTVILITATEVAADLLLEADTMEFNGEFVLWDVANNVHSYLGYYHPERVDSVMQGTFALAIFTGYGTERFVSVACAHDKL